MAGIHLLPQLGACAFGSFLAGVVSRKRNNTAYTLIAASCLQLVGLILLSLLSDVDTEIYAQYGYQVIFGLGIGLSFASVTILTSVRSHQDDLAVAQGALAQARVFGGAIGIAACSKFPTSLMSLVLYLMIVVIIVNTGFQSNLGETLGPKDMSALLHNAQTAKFFPQNTLDAIRSVYATAFTESIKVMIVLSAVGLITSFFSFERHPPAMPHQETKKDTIGGQSESSQVELNMHSEFSEIELN